MSHTTQTSIEVDPPKKKMEFWKMILLEMALALVKWFQQFVTPGLLYHLVQIAISYQFPSGPCRSI